MVASPRFCLAHLSTAVKLEWRVCRGPLRLLGKAGARSRDTGLELSELVPLTGIAVKR